MHTVRAFRLFLSSVLLILALIAGVQGYWISLVTGLFASAVAALLAIAVEGSTRAEAETAARSGRWRRQRPSMTPWADVLYVAAVAIGAWTTFPLAQPA